MYYANVTEVDAPPETNTQSINHIDVHKLMIYTYDWQTTAQDGK